MRQQWKITTSNIIFGVIIKFYVVFLEMVMVMVITVLSASLHLCTTHCHIRLSSGVHNTARPSCGCPHNLPNPHHCYRAGAHSHEQQARFLWDSVLKKNNKNKNRTPQRRMSLKIIFTISWFLREGGKLPLAIFLAS